MFKEAYRSRNVRLALAGTMVMLFPSVASAQTAYGYCEIGVREPFEMSYTQVFTHNKPCEVAQLCAPLTKEFETTRSTTAEYGARCFSYKTSAEAEAGRQRNMAYQRDDMHNPVTTISWSPSNVPSRSPRSQSVATFRTTGPSIAETSANCTPRRSLASGNRLRCTQAGEQEYGYCEVIYHKPQGVPNEHYYSVIFEQKWPGGVNANTRIGNANVNVFPQTVQQVYGRNLPISSFCDYATTKSAAFAARESQKRNASVSRVAKVRVVQTELRP